MAMTKCKECGTEISTKAAACPKCGAVMPKKTSGCAMIVGACFAIFIVAPMVMVSVGSKKPLSPEAQKQQEAEQLATDACEAAKKAITGALKAPSTAEFPGCFLGRDQIEIRSNPEKTIYMVRSWVDSQNSFGAMVRTKWAVELARDPKTGRFEVKKAAVD